MIPGRGKPLTEEASQSAKHTPLMLFDCRGYEPVGYVFGSGWKAESVSFRVSLSSPPPPTPLFSSFLLLLNTKNEEYFGEDKADKCFAVEL
jgi:hypothetical protein